MKLSPTLKRKLRNRLIDVINPRRTDCAKSVKKVDELKKKLVVSKRNELDPGAPAR